MFACSNSTASSVRCLRLQVRPRPRPVMPRAVRAPRTAYDAPMKPGAYGALRLFCDPRGPRCASIHRSAGGRSVDSHQNPPLALLVSLSFAAIAGVGSSVGSATEPVGFGSALVGSAPSGVGPSALAVDPATHTIYVATGANFTGPSPGGDTVSVIDSRRCDARDVSRCKGAVADDQGRGLPGRGRDRRPNRHRLRRNQRQGNQWQQHRRRHRVGVQRRDMQRRGHGAAAGRPPRPFPWA